MEKLLKIGDNLTIAVEFDGELIQKIWLPSDVERTNVFELFSRDEILSFERKLVK